MLLIDLSEPDEIIRLIEQSVPVAILNLNQTKRSDYYFGGEDGRTRQFSRKQAGELLSDIDEAESQIRDYYDNADENYQVVEGIISEAPITKRSRPVSSGNISIHRGPAPHRLFSYKVASNGFICNERVHDVSPSMLDAWEYSLNRCGVITYYRTTAIATAKLLVAIYRNCQKPPENHTTLQRYIIPRIRLEHHDPFVEALMSLSLAYKIGIGEKKARILATRYKTLFDLTMAEVDELCYCEGIGKEIAKRLLKALGRDDI